MAGPIEGVMNFGAGLFTSAQNKKDAKKNRERQLDFVSNLNWDPAYASDAAPTYKAAESPVARAYLESILTGTNPDMTFSGSPNAGFVKGDQQAAQNAQYGTPQERVARARMLLEQQPWAVQSPRELGGVGGQEGGPGSLNKTQDMFAARYPLLGQSGWTQADLDKLSGIAGEKVKLPSGVSEGDAPAGVGKVKSTDWVALKEALDRGADYDEVRDLYRKAMFPGIKF